MISQDTFILLHFTGPKKIRPKISALTVCTSIYFSLWFEIGVLRMGLTMLALAQADLAVGNACWTRLSIIM